MNTVSPKSLPLESLISLMIDGIVMSSDATIVEPMLINLDDKQHYYISDLNLASVYDPEFGDFLFEYTRETSKMMESKRSVLLFPAIYDTEAKSLGVVDFIDFNEEIPDHPFVIAIIDDGEKLEAKIFELRGIPGTCLLSIHRDDIKASPSFLEPLIEHWEVDETVKPGMFHQTKPEDEPRYDPMIDLSWHSISELMPVSH